MDVVASSLSANNYINECVINVEPSLHKFIFIINSSSIVEQVCKEHKIVPWLDQIERELESKNTAEYNELIFSVLQLNASSSLKKIEKKQQIARIYADILVQYIPNSKGELNQTFKYFDLVNAVKTTFRQHLDKSKDLFSIGIQVGSGFKGFYSKVEGDRVCILSILSEPAIASGGHGSVRKVFEITTRQFYAFKISMNTAEDRGYILKEIDNLKMLHSLEGGSVEGLQPPPYWTLNMPFLTGFIGPLYEVDLSVWYTGAHEKSKRLKMAKSLMSAFKNKMDRGLWHGDLKDKNVLAKGEECVIIDWAGVITFEESLRQVKLPLFYCYSHIYKNDYERLDMHMRFRFVDLDEFTALAYASDLFSVAIILFQILGGEKPFEELCTMTPWPLVEKGIRPYAMQKLKEKGYQDPVVNAVTKMLNINYRERYSSQQAIALWDKICMQ